MRDVYMWEWKQRDVNILFIVASMSLGTWVDYVLCWVLGGSKLWILSKNIFKINMGNAERSNYQIEWNS